MTDADDPLLQTLARALVRTDPLPPIVEQMAMAVPSLADIDGKLAELVEEQAAVRSSAAENQLLFQTEDVTIVALFEDRVLKVDVIGEGNVSVSMERPGGDAIPLRLEDGLFIGPPGSEGIVRLKVTSRAGMSIASDWFVLT